jgi:hypothetical protein
MGNEFPQCSKVVVSASLEDSEIPGQRNSNRFYMRVIVTASPENREIKKGRKKEKKSGYGA